MLKTSTQINLKLDYFKVRLTYNMKSQLYMLQKNLKPTNSIGQYCVFLLNYNFINVALQSFHSIYFLMNRH